MNVQKINTQMAMISAAYLLEAMEGQSGRYCYEGWIGEGKALSVLMDVLKEAMILSGVSKEAGDGFSVVLTKKPANLYLEYQDAHTGKAFLVSWILEKTGFKVYEKRNLAPDNREIEALTERLLRRYATVSWSEQVSEDGDSVKITADDNILVLKNIAEVLFQQDEIRECLKTLEQELRSGLLYAGDARIKGARFQKIAMRFL